MQNRGPFSRGMEDARGNGNGTRRERSKTRFSSLEKGDTVVRLFRSKETAVTHEPNNRPSVRRGSLRCSLRGN